MSIPFKITKQRFYLLVSKTNLFSIDWFLNLTLGSETINEFFRILRFQSCHIQQPKNTA